MKNTTLYTLGYLSIGFTGIHFFSDGAIAKTLFVIILIAVYGISIYENMRFFAILLVFTIINVLQHIAFGNTNIYQVIAALSIMVFIPYTLIDKMRMDFPKYYVKGLTLICLISLPMYFACLAIPGVYEMLSQIPKKYPFLDPGIWDSQLIIFSTEPNFDPNLGILRNSGAFHEPGVFGFFLNIGIYFNYLITSKLFNKVGVLFIICSITTLSTAAFLGIAVTIFGILLYYQRYSFLKVILLPITLALFFQFIVTNPLMGPKIRNEYNLAMSKNMDRYSGGRFFGARRAIYVINKYPITGKGFLPSTREENPNSREWVQYGILFEISKMGIIVSILYLIYFWKGVMAISVFYDNRKTGYFFFFALILNMFSQSFALSVIFLMFVYLGVSSNHYKSIDT